MSIDHTAIAALTPQQRRELLQHLLEEEARQPRVHPLSFAQERLWFLDQLHPGRPVYNMPVTYAWNRLLDADALRRSVNEIVRRHEILRTTFSAVAGRPMQVVAPALELPLPIVDLRDRPAAAREADALRRAEEEAQAPFDLANGPLLRMTILSLGETKHRLLVTMHHIVSDGWSMSIFFWELQLLYEAFRQGRPSPLPELPLQYADYARRQREALRGEALERQLAFWKRKLESVPQVLELPISRPRPPQQTFRGAVHSFSLPPVLSEELRQLGRQEGATAFMVLLAGFQVLLFRYTRQRSLLVGAPVSGRSRTEIEALIGFFVNTLVLPGNLAGDPGFGELLRRTRQTVLEAFAHQELPFEKLVEELRPSRDASRNPLVQVTFTLQAAAREPAAAAPDGVTEPPQAYSGTAKFDLILSMTDAVGAFHGGFEYNTDLFDEGAVARMADHYRILLAAAVERLDRPLSLLPLLTGAERQAMLVERNRTLAPYPDRATVHDLFAAQAARTPAAVAVEAGENRLTYRELERRASGLARVLRRFGVGPEVRVGLCLDRCAELPVAVLAVLEAGGAFLPLDPQYPRERLAYLLADAAVPIVLTLERLRRTVPPGGSWQVVALDALEKEPRHDDGAPPPASGVTPDHLAYVIYTSGSTGRPKGVMVAHRGVVNLVTAMVPLLKLGPRARVLQFSSFSFDAVVRELFESLLSGATLVLASEAERLPGEPLAELLRARRITAVTLPPTALAATSAEGLPCLGTVLAAGEACPAEVAGRWAPGRRFFNAYGPTEDTVCTTVARGRPGHARPPIGRPLANTRTYVLDPGLEPVPDLVPGELYIGGVGLARGYLGRPELTAERFVPDPFASEPGARLYRSGDLVRWLEDGEIEFLGRLDHQVKLRGVRIEPGEIEAVLGAHPAVAEAIVLLRENAPGEPRLVGYVASRERHPSLETELRGLLRETLPQHLVPSVLVVLPAFPLNPAGKIDRRALPEPSAVRPEISSAYGGPRTPVEGTLAKIWAAVLDLDRVGVDDDFFELGGHSLLATQIASRMRDGFGIEVPVSRVFELPTVAELARWVEEASCSGGAAASSEPLAPVARDGPLAPSFAQERLWFLDRLQPGSPAYNVPEPLGLSGVAPRLLACCLAEIVRRHEVLRTTFDSLDGRPVQVVHPPFHPALPVVDLGSLSEPAREAAIRRLATEDARRPFDLARGPLLRTTLLQLEGSRQLLLLNLHHAVCDGWSMQVFFAELSALLGAFLRGKPSPLPPLPLQYADYAAWQRRRLSGETARRLVEFWRDHLAGAPRRLDLPFDRPRPAVKGYRGERLSFALPRDLGRAIYELGLEEGASLFMTLLAAFKTLLRRESGQTRVVVGIPVAGRERPELEPLIGLFSNTLVLHTNLAGHLSFRDLLCRVRETVLAAFAHQELPLELLVAELRPERDLAANPLFQAFFSFQSVAPASRSQALAWTSNLPAIEPAPSADGPLLLTGTAKFDLELAVIESQAGLQCAFEYSTDLFERETIADLARRFRVLLEGVAGQPDRPILDIPLDEGEAGQPFAPGGESVDRFSFEV